jgi:hypothetical protein
MQVATGEPLAGFAAVDSWAARRRTQNPSIRWAESKTLARECGQPDRCWSMSSVVVVRISEYFEVSCGKVRPNLLGHRDGQRQLVARFSYFFDSPAVTKPANISEVR